jgi:prolyl-tRNA editing enzyme YbaK/EbsC (Cys-tRNA(Pro) deacylase)
MEHRQLEHRNLLDLRVAAYLDQAGTPYEIVPIDPDYADTAAFCEKYGYPPGQSANTIIIASKRKDPATYCACVVLATTRLDVNRTVKQLMNVSRVSFANAGQMMELTGMKMGGVTPFGLPDDLPLYVDSRIMSLDWIILGSGGRESKLKISPGVFEQMPFAKTIENLAK